MPENKTSETSSDLPAGRQGILRRFAPQDDSFAVIFKELKGITKKLEQLNKRANKINKNRRR
jgi:hypothetical protein